MKKKIEVKYINFGLNTARQFWIEIASPSFNRFINNPGSFTAVEAAILEWHVHDWLWHDNNKGENTWNNTDYKKFCTSIFKSCPDLEIVRDMADGGKHRGLGRQEVKVVSTKIMPDILTINGEPLTIGGEAFWSNALQIELTDGTWRNAVQVLTTVHDFWRTKLGGETPGARGEMP